MIKPIRTEKDYERALSSIYTLMHKERTTLESDELEILSLLVKEYEKQHYPLPPLNPLEAIKFRIDQMGISPAELNAILGSRSRRSDIFSGRRKLSIRMIRLLHQKLNIPAETLISEY
ncbi:MAG: transcriptional regulator [Chitinophagales bacterium]|nr:transcriptional regulator [Chitinophagales bacterium]